MTLAQTVADLLFDIVPVGPAASVFLNIRSDGGWGTYLDGSVRIRKTGTFV